MEAIPALPRYSVWCPIQENLLVMRGERGRERGREGRGREGRMERKGEGEWKGGGERERGGREKWEGGREGEREGRMTYKMILYLGRR